MEFEKDQQAIKKTIRAVQVFLLEKNRDYGNSALNPISIFTKHITSEKPELNGILVRSDDKLSRIKNADMLRKNDVVDLLGYLILLCVNQDWTNFEEFLNE